MRPNEIVLEHELDAAWIITIWKLIHGGDPAVKTIAAEAIAALAPYLHGGNGSLTFTELERTFASIGIRVTEHREEETRSLEEPIDRPRQYCFQFKGETICTELPRLSHLLQAA